MSNAVWQAERRERIDCQQADRVIQSFAQLDIEIVPHSWRELFPLARQFERSVYDAAYLALAERLGEPMITADERLFNAVHSELDWVVWIGDYPLEAQP